MGPLVKLGYAACDSWMEKKALSSDLLSQYTSVAYDGLRHSDDPYKILNRSIGVMRSAKKTKVVPLAAHGELGLLESMLNERKIIRSI